MLNRWACSNIRRRLSSAIALQLLETPHGALGSFAFRAVPGVVFESSWWMDQRSYHSYCQKKWNTLGVPLPNALAQQSSWLSSRARGKDHEAWGRGKTPYEILEVSPTVTKKELKVAYFKAAKKHHPDVNPGDEEGARARFQYVSAAYEVLSDDRKRREYDANARASAWSGGGTQTNRQHRGAANDWKRRQQQTDGYQSYNQQQQQQWYNQTNSYGNYRASNDFFHYMSREDLEIIKEAFAEYEKEMREDVTFAVEAINKGEFRKAGSVLSEYTGVVLGIFLPVAAILRFPALVVAVSTFLFRFGFYILVTIATDYYGIFGLIWRFFVRRAKNRAARRAARRQ